MKSGAIKSEAVRVVSEIKSRMEGVDRSVLFLLKFTGTDFS